MDNKQQRLAERNRKRAAELRQQEYPTDICLKCGATVRKTFTSADVPELLEFLANRGMSFEAFADAARRRLGSPEGCLFAPKSGISVCDRKESRK